MNEIKLFGERNTGTIYLEWLLNNNLDIKLLNDFNLGWKHRLAPDIDELTSGSKEEIIFICMVKNPYSWIYSMHKRPYKHEKLSKLTFHDFIRYSYGDYRNPVVLWNKKNKSYLELKNYVKYHHLIKYEDLLLDSRKCLDQVADKFQLSRSSVWFTDINQTLTNHHGIVKQKFRKEFYLKEEWINKFNFSDFEFVNNQLDKEVLKALKYSMVVVEEGT